jgi:hypothetical protein
MLHQELLTLERKVAALASATSSAGTALRAAFSRRLVQARAEVQRRDSLREASEEVKTITEEPQLKTRFGLTWFKQDDWPRWLEIDPRFQPDYSHWLRRSLKTLAGLEEMGIHVVKVNVRPDEFKVWAEKAGRPIDTHARAAFAAEKARAMELN